MSDREQEMINAVRRGYEAFNRGDFDTAIEQFHPEIVFVPPGDQTPLRGADAMRAWMEPDAFESQQLQPREFRAHGNKVLVRQHARARGAGSGIEIETWVLWTLDDDGLAMRVEGFLPQLQEPRVLLLVQSAKSDSPAASKACAS
jgi:ketosteroid isomerase-like protein